MAKTQANFPTSLDVLNTDREAGQVITSASYDVIEDAITEIEAEIRRVTPKTGTATLTEAMGGTVLVSAAGAAYTITLPTAAGNTGLTYHFIKTDANYTLITLAANGAETFNYESSTGAPVATYARLNTYCAEVTIVSDGANWQCINERLGQVPTCRVYLSANMIDIFQDYDVFIDLNTENYDIGSNFDNSVRISGNASATTSGHLIDTVNNPFTADMQYHRIKNTTDTTYTYISAVNSSSDVTVRDNIFVSGEGYELKNAKYVIPVAGIYEVIASAYWVYNSIVATKNYGLRMYVNLTTEISSNFAHSALIKGVSQKIITPYDFSVNDTITLYIVNESGSDAPDLQGGTADTFMAIRLLSKD